MLLIKTFYKDRIMSKFLVLAIVFLGSCSFTSLLADKLDEFEQLFEEVANNYTEAKKAQKNSRFTSAFEKKLSDLTMKGREVQTIVARLRIKDIDIPHEVNRLKEGYYDFKRTGRNRGKGRMEKRSGKWDPIHKIRSSIKTLKKNGVLG